MFFLAGLPILMIIQSNVLFSTIWAERISFEFAINKQTTSWHFAWRNRSIAARMFVQPTNTAVILDLKGFLINQKLLLSTSEYHYYYQGRKWNVPDFWNSIIILSLPHFLFTNLFFPPSRLVCFLVVVPFVAFPSLLQQLQEKNE